MACPLGLGFWAQKSGDRLRGEGVCPELWQVGISHGTVKDRGLMGRKGGVSLPSAGSSMGHTASLWLLQQHRLAQPGCLCGKLSPTPAACHTHSLISGSGFQVCPSPVTCTQVP